MTIRNFSRNVNKNSKQFKLKFIVFNFFLAKALFLDIRPSLIFIYCRDLCLVYKLANNIRLIVFGSSVKDIVQIARDNDDLTCLTLSE